MAIVAQTSRTLFNGTNIVSSAGFCYNASRSTAATSGWFRSKADHILVQIGCATLTATSVTYRVEGKIDGIDRIASVAVGAIAQADNIDKIVAISEKYSYVRLGIKTVIDASPNNVWAGLALAEIR